MNRAVSCRPTYRPAPRLSAHRLPPCSTVTGISRAVGSVPAEGGGDLEDAVRVAGRDGLLLHPADCPVVVGVDGSPLSTEAIGFAFAEAAQRGTSLVAAHAWLYPTPVGPGDIVPLVVEESTDAQLTVVGAHGRGAFLGLLLGSVSHAVLHQARSPLAIVRHHRGGDPA